MSNSKTLAHQKYASLHPLRRLLVNRFLNKVFEEIRKTNSRVILDVGCSEGQADKFFLEKDPSLKITGVDLDVEALEQAEINCPQMEIERADVYHLPFRDNTFDLVIFLEVLEHLEFPEKALEEIKRVGRVHFIFSVPNEPFFSLASLFSGKYLKTLGRHPCHLQSWSKKKLENLLEEFFDQTEVKTVFPWLICTGDLKKL